MKTKSTAVLNRQQNNATAMEIEIEEKNIRRRNGSGKRFLLWLIGLFVSLAPLFVVHFGAYVKENKNLFYGLFGDAEIFFICVSMLVSAACEANTQRKQRTTFNGFLILCIVVLALMYSEFNNYKTPDSIAGTVSIVTLISLGITFVCGLLVYFRKER